VDEIADDLPAALEEFAALVAAHVDVDSADTDVVDPAVAEAAATEAVEEAAPAGTWPGRTDPLPDAGSPEAEALRDALDGAHGPAETRRTWARRLEGQGAPAVGRALDLLQNLPGST